jgi:hypothetical protein
MTLVCKNNTSSTRERAFAFASFFLSLSLSLSCAQHIMSVDRLGKRVLLLLLLLFLDQSSKFDLVVCAMLFFFSSMPFALISSCFWTPRVTVYVDFDKSKKHSCFSHFYVKKKKKIKLHWKQVDNNNKTSWCFIFIF